MARHCPAWWDDRMEPPPPGSVFPQAARPARLDRAAPASNGLQEPPLGGSSRRFGLEGAEALGHAFGREKLRESLRLIAISRPSAERHAFGLFHGIGGKFPKPQLIRLRPMQIRPKGKLPFGFGNS